jgi:arginyl-tRNA synthetase
MLAYKLWGNDKTPKSENKKPDHFVGDFYVLYSKKVKDNPELEKEIKVMLKKWEDGDKKTIKLWKRMNGWALQGFNETYKKFGIKFDKTYNESEHYKNAKNIVINSLKKGVFEKDAQGNVVAKLKQFDLPNKVLLRADGTSVYITQDIYLAKLKYDDYKTDRSVYVVGSEQILYFKQLFKILELLKFKNIDGLYHLPYGMVYLPEGRMKSREGTVVNADDLVEEVVKLARKEIEKRHKLSKKEIETRANTIGLGALIYFILKYDPLKDFTYYPEESLSFEGDTGPYLQYTYARANSILRKGKKKPKIEKLTEEKEFEIIKKLSKFSDIIKKSVQDYKPNYIATYLFDLATLFNEYYHETRVIGSKNEEARLALVKSVIIVLENGLKLLGIEAPKEM